MVKLQSTTLAKEIHEDSLKKKTAFSACDVSQRSFPCPAGIVTRVRPHRTILGRSTKTVLCEQRRHTLCQGKEAHGSPAESVVYFRSGMLSRSLYQLRGLKAIKLTKKA